MHGNYIIVKKTFLYKMKECTNNRNLYIKMFLEAWIKSMYWLEFGRVLQKRTTPQNIHLVDNSAILNTHMINSMQRGSIIEQYTTSF